MGMFDVFRSHDGWVIQKFVRDVIVFLGRQVGGEGGGNSARVNHGLSPNMTKKKKNHNQLEQIQLADGLLNTMMKISYLPHMLASASKIDVLPMNWIHKETAAGTCQRENVIQRKYRALQ